jgi:hypothetical protein
LLQEWFTCSSMLPMKPLVLVWIRSRKCTTIGRVAVTF